ncbi:MAG: twin-arginine translocation signal domain-containing protein [Chthoniobacteraceae bacterium]
MNTNPRSLICSDCDGFSRRDFLKTSLGVAAASTLGSVPIIGRAADAAATPKPTSETLVTTLYKSLNDGQHKALCLPFDNPLRTEVDNNWHIVDEKIGSFLDKDQQQMVREIFLGLHSPEYADKVMQQVVHDSGQAGFEDSSIALFGEPGTGKFEFVLTGRHCTRRCDGDSVEGAAFGGPIFYGHAAESFNEKPDHPGNVYWYQAQRANEVFQALDGKQREMALRKHGRMEQGPETVKLKGKTEGLPGISLTELAPDQRELVRKVMSDLLAPFRQQDADEALKYIEAAGFENLHMAFYKDQDIGKDGVWDVWQLEGPNMVWYFRGDPHVHVWANVRAAA